MIRESFLSTTRASEYLVALLLGQGFGMRCLPRRDSLGDFVHPIHFLNSPEERGIRITSEGMSDTPFLSVWSSLSHQSPKRNF